MLPDTNQRQTRPKKYPGFNLIETEVFESFPHMLGKGVEEEKKRRVSRPQSPDEC